MNDYQRILTRFENIGLPLKPHQQEGVKWLLEKEDQNIGGILADEPGLGKTFQTLALAWARTPVFKSTLVVVPTSIIDQWATAAKKIVGETAVYVHYGKRTRDRFPMKKIVITTYGVILSEHSIATKNWHRLILDEVHAIKNRKSKISKTMMDFPGKFRWGLSGTPVQNSKLEISNLFRFVLGFPSDSRDSLDLQNMLDNNLLRRTKQKVLGNQIPRLTIDNIEVNFQSEQEMNFYRKVLRNVKSEFQQLQDQCLTAREENVVMFELLLRLRQSAQHPQLVHDGFSRKYKRPFKWSGPQFSSKHLALLEQLQLHPYESSLIFSQFTGEMDLLEPLLSPYFDIYRLDGSLCRARREDVLQKCSQPQTDTRLVSKTFFNSHIQKHIQTFIRPRVFMIQIKAGGVGLNLQQFSRVYITSPDWNPCNEIQAIARAHRLGQTKPVRVVKLLLSDSEHSTIDHKIEAIQDKKRDMMATMLKDDQLRFNGNKKKLSLTRNDMAKLFK